MSDKYDVDLDSMINELNEIDYKTLAEKTIQLFPEFYTKFKNEFTEDSTNEDKQEMIKTTYAMCLELLNTTLSQLEYTYLLTLSIAKAIEEFGITFNELEAESMELTNKFIKHIASNITMTLGGDVSKLLTKMKDMEN